jgi:intein-encoded DNA endonuclease-like protein
LSKTTTVKQLREKYGVKPSEEVSARTKEQAKTIRSIIKTVSSGPKTIPEISRNAKLDMRLTTWYVLTLTRHKKLQAVKKTEEGYWLYAPAAEEGD